MCSNPKLRIMSTVFHAAGAKRVPAPATIKAAPITGTIRTENAPAATTPVPYSSIQMPGSSAYIPRCMNAKVTTMPTTNTGVKLNNSLRAEPVRSGRLADLALSYMNQTEIRSARNASTAQTTTHSTDGPRVAETRAATIAVVPMTTCPQPETAVNVPA